MAEVILRDELATLWTEDNAFEKVRAVKGKVAKAKDNRRVVRFELDGGAYYLKHHVGIGWKEIFKNLLQVKLPVLGASNEWYAIERLKELGIDTMEAVGFGQRGLNPAEQESFLVTRELADTLTLETFCQQWRESPPKLQEKRVLIERVAKIARRIHSNGLTHRDFYLCHILMEAGGELERPDPINAKLYLVDLHRMLQFGQLPRRWQVKDIGSIYFSSLDIGLTRRDIIHFIRAYSGKPIRKALQDRFWQEVSLRAVKLYRRDFGREPELLL